jgi:hypothetical protein
MGEIRLYKNDDYVEIVDWFTGRGLPCPSSDRFPPIGFIVPGVAAGFLLLTDGCVSFIDGIVSNPNAEKGARSEAIFKIFENLIAFSKAKGFKSICGTTEIPAMEEYAINAGLEEVATHSIYLKELN